MLCMPKVKMGGLQKAKGFYINYTAKQNGPK